MFRKKVILLSLELHIYATLCPNKKSINTTFHKINTFGITLHSEVVWRIYAAINDYKHTGSLLLTKLAKSAAE